VGKIDELDNAVNHGVSNGYHGVYATDGQAIDKLLQKQAPSPVVLEASEKGFSGASSDVSDR
jgi:hypothetical protein